jgi:N-acetylmuramoyl-L-alanine amidase
MTRTTERVKRRLLKQVFADNLDTIRGLPPRSVRRGHRTFRIWLKRGPLFLLFLGLAGSTYLASNPTAAHDTFITRARGPVAAASVIDSAGMSIAALPLSVHRVVIDAGHGGNDPGTTSSALLSEKDVTLDVAKRLAALLEKSGLEVVRTRSDDRLIPLRERARLANASDGDIFVSIHVNSIEQHTSEHGVETYYLGPTKDPTLTKLAADENRMSGYSVADLRKLLDGIYADARRDESQRLAGAVQGQLFTNLKAKDHGLENWGVKRAPFIVLVATDMPAILAEVGCMSNPSEVAMLQRAEYRQQIAAALFEGIHAYASAAEAPQKRGT